VNPEYPIYIVSKGRWESRLTSKSLEEMRVPYHIVVEEQEYRQYAAVIDRKKILVLDQGYQERYDTCDGLDGTKGRGPGPARNFAWDHSVQSGAERHWVMDDNIRCFYRLNRNRKIRVGDGTTLRLMELFVDRYENVVMAGPNYEPLVTRKEKMSNPFVLNTRIYSCNLIRNDIPFRWRGRYNEDTDLSLRILKAGYCTVQFNAFLQKKIATQLMSGGNTDEFYAKEGTFPKSEMLYRLHPDVTRIVWRFHRCHHLVDYSRFKKNRLIRKPGVEIPSGVNDFGMRIVKIR
jgi:hypothetical protein